MLVPRKTPIVILVAALALCAPAFSQWSSNAANNLPIADLAGDQQVPKLSARADGGCWIAWFDHRGSNYDVYLQRLDANGYEAFPHNGLLVSNNAQSSSLVDWDLITDSAGNAVLAFTDVRAGGDLDVYAYRIDPSGAFLWGPNGITLSNDANFEANPVIAEMTDGSFVFAWSRSVTGQVARLVIQKLDVNGVPQFGAAGIEIFGGATDDPGFVGIVPGLSGAFILSWIRDTTPFSSPKHLWTQKYDSAGVAQWGTPVPAPVVVYDAASLPIAYKPEMQSDGAGGAFFAWYVSVGSFFQGRVQHVDAAGTEVFGHNGVEISLEASRSELSPSFAQLGGDLIVFYRKENSGQSLWGIGGQRISSTGQLLWGTNGIEFVTYDTTVEEGPRAVPAPNGAMCFAPQGANNTQNRTEIGFRVDGNGNAVWSPSPMTACSAVTSKDKLRAIAASDGTAILVWSDIRSTNGYDLYAQNVELDASLGVPPASATPYGCGVNEPGTLIVVSGTPAIGTVFTVGIDDPSGSMPPASNPFLVVSVAPDPSYPCGTTIPNAAMAAAGLPGELLVDLGQQIVPMLGGPSWTGPGSPVSFAFGLPPAPFLVGYVAYMQGALLDPVSMRIGATNALAVRIGP